jgi:hypothetical protein
VSEIAGRSNGAREQAPPAPSPWLVAPVPRIALTQQEACASLGCSEEFFVEHVRPNMRVVRRGRKRLFPVDELRRAVDDMAEDVL